MVEQSLFDIESIVQDVVYLYDLLPTDEAESLVYRACVICTCGYVLKKIEYRGVGHELV